MKLPAQIKRATARTPLKQKSKSEVIRSKAELRQAAEHKQRARRESPTAMAAASKSAYHSVEEKDRGSYRSPEEKEENGVVAVAGGVESGEGDDGSERRRRVVEAADDELGMGLFEVFDGFAFVED